ncbi:MAG TPA: hypothetical protein VND91_01490 [Candidatus Saccharimonadia bacterium]|nr:hypothetical protein [Candidatus Saccharimonadia bacterium]
MLDLALLFLLSVFVSAGVAFSGLAGGATPVFAVLPYVFGAAFIACCGALAHESMKRRQGDSYGHSNIRTA